MTEAEIKRRWPNASASLIQANLGKHLPPAVDAGKYQIPPFAPPESKDLINVSWENRFNLLDWLSDIDHSSVETRVVSYSVNILPMGAPRMVHSDRWSKNPRILRYFEFKNKLRAAIGNPEVPDGVIAKVFIPVCASASEKKVSKKTTKPHTNLGDVDNHAKGILDALFEQDKRIWLLGISKFWCKQGEERIELKLIYFFKK